MEQRARKATYCTHDFQHPGSGTVVSRLIFSRHTFPQCFQLNSSGGCPKGDDAFSLRLLAHVCAMHLLLPPPMRSFSPRTTGSSCQRARVPPPQAMATTQSSHLRAPPAAGRAPGLWDGSSFAGGEHCSEFTATSLNTGAHPDAAEPPFQLRIPTTAGTSATGDTGGHEFLLRVALVA